MEEPKYVKFIEYAIGNGKKTKGWFVVDKKTDRHIGQVILYVPEKTYRYFSTYAIVYEPECMRDIANFVEEKIELHKKEITESLNFSKDGRTEIY